MQGRLPIVSNTEAACTAGAAPRRGPTAAMHAEGEFGGNVLLVTLGCAKNLVDSEIMLGALKAKGFRPISDPKEADLIVVNTCAFLQSAVEEGIDRILELSAYKKEGRLRRLVVAGCMVERYRDQLVATLPEVDQFLNTDELLDVANCTPTTSATLDAARRPYFLYDESMPRIRSTAGHTAFLKIAEGCDRPCAFCIIPKIRGSFRSRSVDSICREAEMLIDDGVKELNLVAQDLTAYGSDLNGNRGIKSELSNLLRRLGSLRGQEYWIRLLYAYPIGVTEELIALVRETPVICSYLDLPLQHISHPVLKRMQRPLGESGTRALIEKIRQTAPELALRTTFVVGFPGETDEDIASLEQFVSEGHFTHVGAFTYSQEEEAKSYTFPDQVPDELKEERRARIMEAQQRVVAVRAEALKGKRVRVLVDGAHSESDLLLVGRSAAQGPETDGEVIINEFDDVYLDDEGFDVRSLHGTFQTVEITDVLGYDFVGRLLA